MFRKSISTLVLAGLATQLGGCMAAYDGIRHPGYVAGRVTPQAIQESRKQDKHCTEVAKETTPSNGKVAVTEGVNGVVGGTTGGGAGSAATAVLMGNPVTGTVVAVGAVAYGLGAGAIGVARSKDVAVRDRFYAKGGCLMAEAQGIHVIKPSDMDRLGSDAPATNERPRPSNERTNAAQDNSPND